MKIFIKKWIPFIILIIIAGYFFLFWDGSSQKQPKGLEVSIPSGFSVAGQDSFACKALLSANAFGNSITNTVDGDVAKGTDSMAIQINNDETLTFATGASIDIGMANGDKFTVLENDDQKLTAVWYQGGVISSLVLNKTNGLGVWTKANPDFALLGVPIGYAVYMSCL